MDFPGFKNSSSTVDPEESFNEELEESLDGLSSSDLTSSISSELVIIISKLNLVRGMVEKKIYDRILIDSKKKWAEEKDFDPLILKSRGFNSGSNLPQSFFDSLPKIHPEIKMKETTSPNNVLVIKLLKETTRLLNILKTSV